MAPSGKLKRVFHDPKIVPVKDLTFQPRNITSKYDRIIIAARKLKSGQALQLKVPRGLDAKVYRNRIASVVKRKVQPDAPGPLTIRTVSSSEIAICCGYYPQAKKKTSRRKR